VVLVEDAAEELLSSDRSVDGDDLGGVVVGWVLVEALVWAVDVEMLLVGGEHVAGVPFVVDFATRCRTW
jgi:hypothetical protein